MDDNERDIQAVLAGQRDWFVATGDVLDMLRLIPDNSIQCVVTSPPYWGLRDYQMGDWEGGDPQCNHQVGHMTHRGLSAKQRSNAGSLRIQATSQCPKCGAVRQNKQLGAEACPDCLGWATGQACGECYICHLLAVFAEARRVLRPDGLLWLNIGDSMNGYPGNAGSSGIWANNDTDKRQRKPGGYGLAAKTLKQKDLIGIPARLQLALQAQGWYFRCDVIWAKANPMPESVRDRPKKSHEHILMFSKSARYYYDRIAVQEPAKIKSMMRFKGGRSSKHKWTMGAPGSTKHTTLQARDNDPNRPSPAMRDLRDVWYFTTQSYKGVHFATFPETLPRLCLKASTSRRGMCHQCGKPWRRVVENTPIQIQRSDRQGRLGRYGRKAASGSMLQATITCTLGWQPTCRCQADEPAPQVVLDVFCGSGTTGAVARQLGLRFIGIDFNPTYVEMANARIAAVQPLPIEEIEPPVIADPVAPQSDQLTLF